MDHAPTYLIAPLTVKRPDPGFTGMAGVVTLPKGLRIRNGFVDEFPPDLFPPGSLELHDAQYRGIRV